MPYLYKTIVHLCAIASNPDSDHITPARLAAETGVTLHDTQRNVRIACEQDPPLLSVEIGTGHLWPTSDGRTMAKRVSHAVRPEPEMGGVDLHEWKTEVLTGMVQSGPREGRISTIEAAVLQTCNATHYRDEPRLEARSELDKMASEISARLDMPRHQVLMLLAAGASSQPVNKRGILMCPRCNRWQVVAWRPNRNGWDSACLECERRRRRDG